MFAPLGYRVMYTGVYRHFVSKCVQIPIHVICVSMSRMFPTSCILPLFSLLGKKNCFIKAWDLSSIFNSFIPIFYFLFSFFFYLSLFHPSFNFLPLIWKHYIQVLSSKKQELLSSFQRKENWKDSRNKWRKAFSLKES